MLCAFAGLILVWFAAGKTFVPRKGAKNAKEKLLSWIELRARGQSSMNYRCNGFCFLFAAKTVETVKSALVETFTPG